MSKALNKARLRKFLSYYAPYRRIFAFDMFFALVSAGAALVFPLLSGYVTGIVLAERTESTLNVLFACGAVMLTLILVRVAADIYYSYYGHAMGAKMEGDMRSELFAHYQNLSFAFHSRESVGKLMTIVANDLTAMTELFHHAPEDIVMTLVKFVGAFVILININAPLTCVVFAMFLPLCILALKTDGTMERALVKVKGDLSDMNVGLEDALSGVRTVKAFGNERFELRRFNVGNHAYVKSKCYFYKVEAIFYSILEQYPQFITMLIVLFGAFFVGRGAFEAPTLVTFLLYISCICDPIKILINFIRLYEEGKVGFIRFMDMIERTPDIIEAPDAVNLTAMRGDIAFERVTFRYDDGECVLNDVSFRITAGQRVGIVGPSGIGKTTISALISRFYDIGEGRVTIDGVDVKRIAFDSLRRNIGIVQQEVFIFNGTVMDNIRYGNPDATDEQVKVAAHAAGASGFIERLESGYHTTVGTRGITLSGGQRQRVSIARVFLMNPTILILDEATSALDYDNERIVQSALNTLMQGRTSIVITHRLTALSDMDAVILLKDNGAEVLSPKGGSNTLSK